VRRAPGCTRPDAPRLAQWRELGRARQPRGGGRAARGGLGGLRSRSMKIWPLESRCTPKFPLMSPEKKEVPAASSVSRVVENVCPPTLISITPL